MARSDGRVKCSTRGCRNYVIPPTTICKPCRKKPSPPQAEPPATPEAAPSDYAATDAAKTRLVAESRAVPLASIALANKPSFDDLLDGLDKPGLTEEQADVLLQRFRTAYPGIARFFKLAPKKLVPTSMRARFLQRFVSNEGAEDRSVMTRQRRRARARREALQAEKVIHGSLSRSERRKLAFASL